jgi:Tol biopolymer transport system component
VLAESSTSKQALAVNPDGSVVAYWDSGRRSIHLLFPDGRPRGELATVSREWPGATPTRISWNPSGTDLAVLLAQSEGLRDLVRIPLDPAGEVSTLSSAVGDNVAWCTENRILIQDLGNTDYSILTPSGEPTGKVFGDRARGWMFFPVCSPGGSEIAFEWNRSDRGLWIVHLDTQRERLLVESPSGSNANPVGWSPDGQWIYFHFIGRRPYGLYRVSVAGGDYHRVLDLPLSTQALAMSTDASTLATIERHGQSDIWMIENFRAGGGY